MYKIINLENVSIDGLGSTINGIYDSIESSTKVKLLTNIVLDGVNKANTIAEFVVDEGNFVAKIYGGTLTITADDDVSFTTE